ncbi:MAG: response regulator [Alphaproteobacteria bacterium]|nr:response regulator [Alphaproteobacteria bacterium]
MTDHAEFNFKGLFQAEGDDMPSAQDGAAPTRRFEVGSPSGVTDTTDAAGQADESANLSAKHILVAEDYHLNQKVISAMLSNLGHRITLVNDGLEAVSAVLRFPYDLILMDVHMPKLDGKAAARRIRALPRPEGDIPIIALTADNSMDLKQQCLDAGMDDYLTKPIVLPDLLRAMAKCLAAVKPPEKDDSTQPASAKSEPQAMEVTAVSIVDAGAMGEFAAIVGWDTVAQLFKTLEKDFDEHRKTITQAAEKNEFTVLRGQIQALNGALGQFGATKAQETAHVIETLCKAGYNETAHDLIPQFLQLCDDSIVELRQLLSANIPA